MCISVRKRLFALAVGLAVTTLAADALAQQDPPPPAAVEPQPLAADPDPPPPPPPPGSYSLAPAYPPGTYAPAPYPVRGRDRYGLREQRERRPRRSRGMMIAGIALLAAGYVPPAMIGIVVGTQSREKCDCRDALRLLIPLVGPLTLWKPDGDLNVFFNGLMLIDSLMQTTGLVLTIFGVIRYNESAREDEYGELRPKPKPPALSFRAAPMPGGVFGSLRLQL